MGAGVTGIVFSFAGLRWRLWSYARDLRGCVTSFRAASRDCRPELESWNHLCKGKNRPPNFPSEERRERAQCMENFEATRELHVCNFFTLSVFMLKKKMDKELTNDNVQR